MKRICAIAMVCLAGSAAGAEPASKLTKPEIAAKAWLTKMTTGKAGVAVTKDKPLMVWVSANADSDACMKLGTYAVLTRPDEIKTLKQCLQDELKGATIPDKELRHGIIDVAISSVAKAHQKAMKDAAKGSQIVEATYGKGEPSSTIYFAVTTDGAIPVVWVDSNEVE